MANEQDPVEDYIKEIQAQFAQMHDDLEGLATTTKTTEKVAQAQVKATQDQTKAVKDQTKVTKEEIKQSKVQTTQAKQQAATLKEMQKNLHRQQMQQGATMADVAAEHLAGGGGVGGAMKAAAGLKVAQFKHRFDPLNIIKKMTGGSRLAVALAGKVMGRKESTVREFADLAPAEEGGLPSSIFGKRASFGAPSKMDTGGGGGPERIDGGKGGLLGKIADTLVKILSRVTGLEVLLQAQSQMTRQELDAAKDAAAEAGAKKTPTKVGFVAKAKEAGGDMMKFFSDLLGKIKLGFVVAVMGLIAAGVMLYKQWDKLKLSFSLLKDSAVDMWNGIKQAFSDAGTWISDEVDKIIDSWVWLFDTIIEGVQDMIAKIPFAGYTAPTKEERRASKEERAKSGGMIGKSTARTLAAEDAAKLATPEAINASLAKLAPQFASKIPADGKAAAIESLKSGSMTGEVVGAGGNLQQATGSPEKVSTGAALTQLAGAAYKETYGVLPSADKSPNKEQRVIGMVEQASQALAGAVASTGPAQVSQAPQTIPSATPGAPVMAAVAPTVGVDLNNAAEARRNAEATGPAGIFAPSTNVNKTINNNSATTINQGMAKTRSGEDTHVRARDRDYAR